MRLIMETLECVCQLQDYDSIHECQGAFPKLERAEILLRHNRQGCQHHLIPADFLYYKYSDTARPSCEEGNKAFRPLQYLQGRNSPDHQSTTRATYHTQP